MSLYRNKSISYGRSSMDIGRKDGINLDFRGRTNNSGIGSAQKGGEISNYFTIGQTAHFTEFSKRNQRGKEKIQNFKIVKD